MKSLLEQVKELDNLIRQMHKMNSKMKAGQFIDAWRECNRIIALLDRAKQDLIKENMMKTEGDDGVKNVE